MPNAAPDVALKFPAPVIVIGRASALGHANPTQAQVVVKWVCESNGLVEKEVPPLARPARKVRFVPSHEPVFFALHFLLQHLTVIRARRGRTCVADREDRGVQQQQHSRRERHDESLATSDDMPSRPQTWLCESLTSAPGGFFWREKPSRVTEGRFFSTQTTIFDFFDLQLCHTKTCAKTICERG